MILTIGEDGVAHKYEKPYCTIDVATEEDFEELKKLTELGRKMHWIPCSKKLPESSGHYLACIYDTSLDGYRIEVIWFAHVDDYYIEDSEWREIDRDKIVTAWMPLPELYKLEAAE